jgi:hypothetical protein
LDWKREINILYDKINKEKKLAFDSILVIPVEVE